DYLDKIEELIDGRNIDYLIINHMEPDHSGAIKTIVEKYPDIKLVGNLKTFKIIESYFGYQDKWYQIEDGDELNLGHHNLKFVMTPWVHWPETMMTYDLTEKILFSGDAFGSFGTLDGGIFDDEIEFEEYYKDEMRRYYSNIVGKYSNMVQKAFKKLEGIEIKYICSTHGPIWRNDVNKVLSLYDKWSKFEAENGVVIIYGSMYGNTAKLADCIARKLSEQGIKKIRIHDASKTHISYLINDIWRYKGVILGSCAYNSGMLPTMENLTRTLEHMGVKGHLLGLFGSYSWNGGGVKALHKFNETVQWELVSDPVDIKGIPGNEAFDRCESIAKAMAEKLKE
ncbi:MAG: FprA family A-type flavoprotein, partial [Bacteroidales bacterium]|nr:FprA family A-type flavoprotein [Bacteroidales bacterium]